MEEQNGRRSFLKHLFSLSAFIAGSGLSFNKDNTLKIGKIKRSEALAMNGTGKRVKKIACEEHANKQDIENLDKRVKAMDEAGIDMQVVQLRLTGDAVSDARTTNDMLAEVVYKKYPGRFAGYFTLPWEDPDAACAEFERAVKDLKLAAPMVYAGESGSYMDDQKYWDIYATAEKLDVPVYIHPGTMLPDMSGPYNSPYQILSGAMWGFSAATSLHAVRLIVSGVFDKYPGLKIMLGHLGEGISYWLWRMDNMYEKYLTILDKNAPGNNLKKPPSQYFKENFYVVTSGMFWEPVLQFCITALGSDRILFGCDYPPEPDLVFASRWIDSVAINDSDREKICHLNAEKLLKI